MTGLARRPLIGALALGLLGAAPAARPLSVALPAGDGLGAAAALRAVYLDPYQASHPRLAVTLWPGDVAALAAGGWDVVACDAATLLAGCAAGLLEKLPWGDKPLAGLRERLLAPAAQDCGMGVLMHATVLAWTAGRVPGSPGWADFWDVVRIPGKRALAAGARGNLELALLADGVMPADVYRVLRSPAGIERALRKLVQLRPYLVWWETPQEALRILGSGEALMASLPAPLVVTANQQGAGLAMQPAGGLVEILSLAVVRDSPNRAEALALLAWAADPARQALLPALGAWAGPARGANDKLPPEQAARSPGTAQALASEVILDAVFWREHGDGLNARFEAMTGR